MHTAGRDPAVIEAVMIVGPKLVRLSVVIPEKILTAILVAEVEQYVFVTDRQKIRAISIIEPIRKRSFLEKQRTFRGPVDQVFRRPQIPFRPYTESMIIFFGRIE